MSADTINNGTNGTNDQSTQSITLVADSTVPTFEFQGGNNNSASSRSIVTMTDETLKRVKLLAQMLEASSFNSSRNPMKQGDYFIIMLKGLAVGLDPIMAVDFISVIQGKPVIDGKGLLALILNAKRAGEVEDIIIDSQEEYCAVTIKRKGMTTHTEKFTLDDARRMKTTSWESGSKKTIPLIEKDNWVQQPRTMLKWRAVAACARVCCADIIGGLYSKEEITDGAIDVLEDGTMTLLPKPTANKPPSVTPLPKSTGTRPKPANDAPTFSTGEMPPPPVELDPLTLNPITPTASDEPDPNDPEDIRHAIPVYGAEHWYVKHYLDFVKLLRMVVPKQDTMVNHEISAEGLRLIGKPTWKDFPSGASAITQLKAKLGIVDKATAPVPTPTPVPQPVISSNDWHSEFADFIWTHFDMSSLAAWETKALKKVSSYTSFEEAVADATAIAQRDLWDIVVAHAKYTGGDRAYIVFEGLFPIRMYGRTSEFKKQVGEGYYTRYGVGAWESGKDYKIGLLRVTWKPSGQGTPVASKVTVLEDEDADITPEELGMTAEELDAMANMDI